MSAKHLSLAVIAVLAMLAIASAACTSSIGRASTAAQQACLPASSLPAALASSADANDCVTGTTSLPDGSAVAGTLDGHILVVENGATTTYPSYGTGAVTALANLRTTTTGEHDLVTYAVDEGIGIFDPAADVGVSFAGHTFFDKGGRPEDSSQYIAQGRFIVMRPVAGRPHLNSAGQYALTKPDGQDEVVIPDAGGTGICARYAASPDALPQLAWCVDLGSELPEIPLPTHVAQPTLPPTGGGCSAASAAHVDASHTLHVVIGDNSIQPSSITVTAGQRYLIDLKVSNPHTLHSLLMTDASGALTRDEDGAIVCLSPAAGSAVASADFVAPGTGGTFYLSDPVHPHLRVKVTVELPGNGEPTLAPEVAALTPPAGERVAPVFPTAATDVRTATPAPVAATPVP